jgi:hypothetical protein
MQALRRKQTSLAGGRPTAEIGNSETAVSMPEIREFSICKPTHRILTFVAVDSFGLTGAAFACCGRSRFASPPPPQRPAPLVVRVDAAGV